MANLARFRSAALLLLACLTLPACTGTPFALPAERPDDFSMLLTVYPEPSPAFGSGSAPPPPAPWLRPARYAVEPDGLLRAESGAGVTEPGFPPVARRLERHEVEYLYDLAATAGAFADDEARVPGPTVFEPPSDRRVVLFEAGAGGRFAATAHDAVPGGTLDPLIRELARLSWLDR